ncbi:MAG: hypothetical protein VST72_02430 [Nitrospirota bacterium]|nr:hypothetical protein [Nitrospirota bacterium]
MKECKAEYHCTAGKPVKTEKTKVGSVQVDSDLKHLNGLESGGVERLPPVPIRTIKQRTRHCLTHCNVL